MSFSGISAVHLSQKDKTCGKQPWILWQRRRSISSKSIWKWRSSLLFHSWMLCFSARCICWMAGNLWITQPGKLDFVSSHWSVFSAWNILHIEYLSIFSNLYCSMLLYSLDSFPWHREITCVTQPLTEKVFKCFSDVTCLWKYLLVFTRYCACFNIEHMWWIW